MAPTKPTVEHTVDRTPEYEKFIEELRAFHEKRGTNFDPEPKMGTITVDLLKLFKYIVDHGGYDKVSDEKLMWRKMCEGLGLMRHNAPADAYTLKQIFYKNLAAYEIKTIHNKEPPPPEILEFTTAKGGGLLTRTLETFQAKNKPDREGSTEDGTPNRERRTEDTPTSGRASRGLREAPPPRVIFHPDTGPSRTSRHSSGQQSGASASTTHSQAQAHPQHNSQPHAAPVTMQQNHPHPSRGGPSHGYNAPGPEMGNPLVQSYQPGPPIQVPLRTVDTPASNPDSFVKKQRLLRQPAGPVPNPGTLVRNSVPMGTLDGPNIYERCLLALRSGIKEEQAFGLNHLVKISYERGDKYKFSQFSGLAEGLTEFALGVGNMFFEIDWTICNDPDADEGDLGELDGINGTADILERIAQLKPKDVHDNFQPAEFTDQLTLVTEAVLTIRNMVMLPDNAWFMADYPPIKDLLCILLHLPPLDLVVELKHCALDIAEQITPFLVLDSEDPLYQTLLAQLQSSDRGIILTSLRAIGRIAMNHPTETNKLGGVPPTVLQSLMDWLLLNDDELVDACLDFLYQYTAVVANLDVLLEATNVEHLVVHLVRLLSHGAKRFQREVVISEARVAYEVSAERVVPIPRDLQERLLGLEEPDRCYGWLRCFFEEDPDAQITQIDIWQAYNAAFLEPMRRMGRPMINAAEFIRHISTVYKNAGAQVIREGPNGEMQKFIMRGIRPRPFPITPEGQAYFQCQWQRAPGPQGQPTRCGVWNLTAENMWRHILVDHLKEIPGEDGKYRNREAAFACLWDDCTKYPKPTTLHLAQLMTHIKTHLRAEEALRSSPVINPTVATVDAAGPSPSPGSGPITSPARRAPTFPSTPASAGKVRVVRPAKTITVTVEETASARDERNPAAAPQAAGIPLSAVLILRNIARNVVKTAAEEKLVKENAAGADATAAGSSKADTVEMGGWNERLFRPVLPRLWEVFTENKLLAPYLTNLFQLLDRGSEKERFEFGV
ncbi:62d917ec-1c40-450b-80a5-dce78bf1d772 [Thermothielavioides terrestris]|uniref:62d917ec-1c40-450b-80a5-dce78bf1d772 n=1 Tax=Thermothielavioides terrestris TaxID=2587410 RepID=A0A3S4EZM3_9PEZI|nr:62d917ec-1c40-450b-80a5-dce78bf1d772 [Thermothielavioides terrestris]